MNTPGMRERKRRGMLLAAERMKYVVELDTRARVRAIRAPKTSPKRPKRGPPMSIPKENVLSR